MNALLLPIGFINLYFFIKNAFHSSSCCKTINTNYSHEKDVVFAALSGLPQHSKWEAIMNFLGFYGCFSAWAHHIHPIFGLLTCIGLNGSWVYGGMMAIIYSHIGMKNRACKGLMFMMVSLVFEMWRILRFLYKPYEMIIWIFLGVGLVLFNLFAYQVKVRKATKAAKIIDDYKLMLANGTKPISVGFDGVYIKAVSKSDIERSVVIDLETL